MITGLKLNNFTAFKNLDLVLSPGINVFLGENGTGKTHVLKVMYSACDIMKTNMNFAEKLIRNFLPSKRSLGRMVHRQKKSANCKVIVSRYDNANLTLSFTNHGKRAKDATIKGEREWISKPTNSVYIPVKEMLSNGPGFRSLYSQREIHFEEIYSDILDRAYLPVARGPIENQRKQLLERLQKVIDGRVSIVNEEFFLKNKQGNLEFTLLAEGIRKLGLLWQLIQNGTLLGGSILFWDEPETNLNPDLYNALINILLELQRCGVQIFLATHNYVILKELDFCKTSNDKVAYHSLFRDSNSKELVCQTTEDYLQIDPNLIANTFNGLYDREIERSLFGRK